MPMACSWFQDRIKDVIKSGGENVASVEVEQALSNAEPRLREVVVIGLPHDRWGEAVTAIAVQKDGEALDERDILKRLRDRLAAHKCPKAIIFTDTLPREDRDRQGAEGGVAQALPGLLSGRLMSGFTPIEGGCCAVPFGIASMALRAWWRLH